MGKPDGGSFKGDLSGGLVALTVALPSCIAYGLLAFGTVEGLDPKIAILTGLVSLMVGGLLAAILGGTPGMITEPRAPLALVMAAVGMGLAAEREAGNLEITVGLIPVLVFFVCAAGGLLQILFGIFRVGNLVKFISYPVIAGFLNGTAVLIVIKQKTNLLGMDVEGAVRPLAIVIGLVTAVVMQYTPRFTRKVHGSIVGLAVGCGLHYGLRAVLGDGHVGGVVGEIPRQLPGPDYATQFFGALDVGGIGGVLPLMIAAAFSIAVLGSIDSLMTAVSLQSMGNPRSKGNRELVGQGIGNVAAACFGGMAGAGAVGPSAANLKSGGRTRLSGVVCSLGMVVAVIALAPVVGVLPKAALSGVLLVIALHMVDDWSVELFKKLRKRENLARLELRQSALVILFVVGVTVWKGLVAAVAVGVGMSIVMFVVMMSRSVIRRMADASRLRSKKQRSSELMEFLEKHGKHIAVVELEGAMFFGSADSLAKEIDRVAAGGATYVILDLKRVRDVDITTARIIRQTFQQLKAQDKVLALSYVEREGPIGLALAESGVLEAMGEELCFTDTDLALEYFEDRLLKELEGAPEETEELKLESLSVLQGLGPEELETVRGALEHVTFGEGETICRQGEAGREMFMLTRGFADVTIEVAEASRTKRLQTFAPGTVFGEMGLLDDAPRSATVVARDGVQVYRLTRDAFEKLGREHPRAALVLLGNLARLLSDRVRASNEMIRELES